MADTSRVRSTPDNLQGGHFDPEAEPVARVESGDTVGIETVWPIHVDALANRGIPRTEILDDETRARREMSREGPGPHWVTGPVYVENAEPDDVLEVRVRDIEFRTDYAFNLFEHGIGVLPEEFSEMNLRVVRLDRDRRTASLGDGIEVPLDPFFGIMAVAPSVETGRASTTPPSYFGGNMDIKVLGVGSTLYFPVSTDGGLFFVGDGHAAQGNGEVDATALETSLTGEFEFRLHKNVSQLACPIAETETHYVVVGFDEDLDVALERAVRAAVSVLTQQEGLPAEEAYRLCSIVVDFDISQAVNTTKGVHGLIPKSVFDGPGGIDPHRFDEPVPWRR
jgi:acetamidase/formamidase